MKVAPGFTSAERQAALQAAAQAVWFPSPKTRVPLLARRGNVDVHALALLCYPGCVLVIDRQTRLLVASSAPGEPRQLALGWSTPPGELRLLADLLPEFIAELQLRASAESGGIA